MKQYTIISLLILLFSTTSCSDWLRPESEDRILEESLFQTESGFHTALNGVYIAMLDQNLYGQKLTMTTFDVMAQYYDTSKPLNSHIYRNIAGFDHQTMKDAVKDIWTKAYELIANLNIIIEHCETDRTVLSERGYNVVKGEALALRAMLHFEMFRIFGPVYRFEPGMLCIPYNDDTDKNVKPLLSATEASGRIIADLKEAERLLEQSDPVITEGNVITAGTSTSENRYRFRGQRLNYFAVQALLARVNLYIGETAKAGEYAKKVISGAAKFFPFATREQVSGQAAVGSVSEASEDRILSSEILFGLYNSSRTSDTYDKLFSNQLEPKNVLRMTDYGASRLYDEEGDLRRCQWQTKRDIESNDGRFFVKYGEVNDLGNEYANLIPLIRMSEMYLIQAECEGSVEPLDKLREARKISRYGTNSGLNRHIEEEYAREFIGEGQLFWFYKRKGETSLRRIYNPQLENLKISTSLYVLDIPDDEKNLRQ